MIQKLINLFRRKQVPPYPREWLEVDWTDPAKREGVRDKINKTIIHYYRDKYGFRQKREFPYHEAILYSLMKVKELPVIDKTAKEEEFNVIEEVNLSEIDL